MALPFFTLLTKPLYHNSSKYQKKERSGGRYTIAASELWAGEKANPPPMLIEAVNLFAMTFKILRFAQDDRVEVLRMTGWRCSGWQG